MHKYTTDELVAQKPSIDEFKKLPRNPIVFVLHNLRSLQNVGLFFRLADAIRAEKIYLTGYTGYPRKENDSREEGVILHAEKEIAKTAIKLIPFAPWEQNGDVLAVLNALRATRHQLVGVEQTDESVDYSLAPYRFPLALLFGHERTGVEEDLLEKCDLIVHIPMLGMGNSHNVAMSAAIISYHLLDSITMYGPTTITSKGQVTIPEEVRLLLNAHPGDKALFTPVPQKKQVVINIVSSNNIVDRLYGSLKSNVPYAPPSVVRQKVGLALAKELGLKK